MSSASPNSKIHTKSVYPSRKAPPSSIPQCVLSAMKQANRDSIFCLPFFFFHFDDTTEI
jgi:hypothetical protein